MSKKLNTASGGRAVIYARYSSHAQRDVSIEQQFDACGKFAANGNYTIVERYADRAVSGKTDNRPQFQRMMRDAHKGGFDFVIAWKSNRMGRNMLQAMVNESKLAELGIKCLYVEEDFDDTAAGRFALRSMMNVNQFYSENMAEDVRRGMEDNAAKRMANGPPPYGYRRGKDGTYEIEENEAAVVREIFNRLLCGWSIYDIQTDLNNRGVKTRRGGPWVNQSFGHVLQNDRYTGVYRWADIEIEGGMPAILDKETFDKVQILLRTKKKPRGKQRSNDEYILSGKLFCGDCGAPMCSQCGTGKSGVKFDYYMCSRKRYEHACSSKNVPKRKLEQAVETIMKAEIINDQFVEWVIDGYSEAAKELRDDSKKLALQSELKDVNMRLENILKAIEAGIFNETTQSRMTELTDRRKALERAIRAEDAANSFPSPDEVRFALYELRAGDLNDRIYLKDLIRSFIRSVYVYEDRLRILFNYGKGASPPPGSRENGESSKDSGVFECSRASPNGSPIQYIVNTFLTFFEVQLPFSR